MRRSALATHSTSPATPATGLSRATWQKADNNMLRRVPWKHAPQIPPREHCASIHPLAAQTIRQTILTSSGHLASHAFPDHHASLVRRTGPEVDAPTQLAAPRRKAPR